MKKIYKISTIFCLFTLLSIQADHSNIKIDMPFTIIAKAAEQKHSWNESKKFKKKKRNITFFYHVSKDQKQVWIYRIKSSKKEQEEIIFPNKIKGMPVTCLGAEKGSDYDDMSNIFGRRVEPYHGQDGYSRIPKSIKKIKFPNRLKTIRTAAFCGFRDLKEIQIPDGVKKLPDYAFYQCENLEKAILPENLDTVQSGSPYSFPTVFKKCKKLKTLQIGKNAKHYQCVNGCLLSKDGKELVLAAPGKQTVKIPETVTSITKMAFPYSRAKKVVFTENIKKIDGGALGGKKIKNIIVPNGSQYYGKSGDCIYDKRTRQLAVGICRNGTLKLNKKIHCLKKNVSIAGKTVRTLVISKQMKQFYKGWYGYMALPFGTRIYFSSQKPPKIGKGTRYFARYCDYYVPEGSLKKYQKWYKRTDEQSSIDFFEYQNLPF